MAPSLFDLNGTQSIPIPVKEEKKAELGNHEVVFSLSPDLESGNTVARLRSLQLANLQNAWVGKTDSKGPVTI